ncbi:hypothetical protein B0H14DRAFT_2415886 [Mycena olivaceomarginata]|nr:hypothetical protein B0H14DRAFT_2415886 [Mycena olivaceomarginata]
MPDLATRLYTLAAQYSDAAERRRKDADQIPTDFPKMWRDLTLRLDGNCAHECHSRDCPHLILFQKNIRGVARNIIFESSRTAYTTMYVDVVNAIKKQAITFGMDNIIGVPAREQALASEARNMSSGVRNMFRKDIFKSIKPQTWVPLADFTFDCAMKYKIGGPGENFSPAFAAHMVILVGRKFFV